jgi:hypothetical protein
MTGTRRLVTARAAAGALLALLIVGTGLGWLNSGQPAATPPASPLSVKVSLAPHPAFFGDVLAAEIDVQIDPSVVSETSIRLTPSFAPYVETAPPRVSRSGGGRRALLSYHYSLQCVSDTCLPLEKPFVLKLTPVTVTARSGAQSLRATAPWPVSFIASRLSAADIATTHFRRATSMPPVSYAVSPSGLADALTAAAALLAITALGLIGFELIRLVERRRARALATLSPLAAALAYTREAAGRRDPADRRKALGLLAETLDGAGASELAGTAGDVAWSEEPPTPDRALALADEVERTAGAEQ